MTVALVLLGILVIGFAIFWMLNPTENGTTFREWVRHFPPPWDVDRWERFKKSKGLNGKED